MGSTRQRARSVQDKELRKTALLAAARELAVEQGVREVTLTAVTARVGLHPSALRRYFESREELLLELAQDGWADWRDGLLAELGAARGLEADRIAVLVAESMVRLPLFCDLLTHVALSLEGAVRIERARQYKFAAGSAYDAMVAAVVAASADLDKVAAQLVLTGAMTIGAYLYQLSQPTETLRRLYEEQPRWAHSALRFREQLTTLLTAVAVGARPSVRRTTGEPLPDVVVEE
ncbi:TetR family transcriptional regulator [Nocardia sp. BMG111209]|uniref:TetR family transcriptional regulator n=1 Tax=Nocardia sp. BMG111209 TaxID=1160137 RepID=UPI00039E3E79|nr:TetR family transcriptional regulator [Nocardia sp. BMG111209]